MSKSLKNYPDPNLILDKYGADATRYVIGAVTSQLPLTVPVIDCSSSTPQWSVATISVSAKKAFARSSPASCSRG